ncbi:MAG: family 1 glycosylhydrolase [Janthinobacterium lividum]
MECTCNRVGDTYFDQMELSGHAHREGDFHKITALGIRTLRVGMLWERFEQQGSWQWSDRCMDGLREAGIRPIAGLMHHGSGPRHTSLLDEDFPIHLAQYAGALARRYPDIDAYTPVNEPNTTARFSAQYGHWHPHHRSTHSYLRALLNQVKATVLSMEAIRRVRPEAQLIQTDDCGSVTGTTALRSIAELLNIRQWLTFDLLFGRVNHQHPMFEYMRSHGISAEDILWFQDHPCPPQVVGVNYYTTSDRHLDDRRHLYPEFLGSSEGPFVDVEAVRVSGLAAVDFARPVQEAWQRYQCPVALTEVHLGGPPEEQIRWLAAAQAGMQQSSLKGVECAALTVWALLGSYFWNELVTRDNGYYEPGVFDMASGEPVPTVLAGVVAELARNQTPSHPALAACGWWARNDRTCYPWAEVSDSEAA